MPSINRTLGRLAATAVVTASLAGVGAASAFAHDGGGNRGGGAPAPTTMSYRGAAPGTWQAPTWQAPAWQPAGQQAWTGTGQTTTAAAVPSTQLYSSLATNVTTSTLSASAGNAYAWGNCTWYAYERRAQLGNPIGSYWGNANAWASSAVRAGFAVSNTPSVGAILVDTSGYWGHVAIVESIGADGSVTISEMNYAGLNVISNRTLSAASASAYQYIA